MLVSAPEHGHLYATNLPLRGIPLLLHLCENAFCLVVDAMGARGHLPIAFDLLLPAHIASLAKLSSYLRVEGGGVIPSRSCASWPHCSRPAASRL